MVLVLTLLFIVVPILEFFVFVQVTDVIGFLPALALVIAFSVAGAWLVKLEGLGVLRRSQEQLQRGEVPATELVNGVLILFAGALMLTPGFLTDILGVFLLLPPTRALVRVVLLRRFERRVRAAFEAPGAAFGAPFGGPFEGAFGSGFATTRVYTGASTYGGPGSPGGSGRPGGSGDRAPRGVLEVHTVDDDPAGGAGPAGRGRAG